MDGLCKYIVTCGLTFLRELSFFACHVRGHHLRIESQTAKIMCAKHSEKQKGQVSPGLRALFRRNDAQICVYIHILWHYVFVITTKFGSCLHVDYISFYVYYLSKLTVWHKSHMCSNIPSISSQEQTYLHNILNEYKNKTHTCSTPLSSTRFALLLLH